MSWGIIILQWTKRYSNLISFLLNFQGRLFVSTTYQRYRLLCLDVDQQRSVVSRRYILAICGKVDVPCSAFSGLRKLLDARQRLAVGRAAVVEPELEPVPDRRVVAGGDDDAAGGLPVEDREGEHRGWRGAVGADRLDAVGGEDLADGDREVLGVEAVVVGDDAAALGAGAPQLVGDRLRADTDVVEGVVVGVVRDSMK